VSHRMEGHGVSKSELDRGARGDAEELDPARGEELLGGEGGVREAHAWEMRDNPWLIWIKT
jgi:hypothetical protein